MPDRPARFDRDSIREAWDHAADAYERAQATGLDYYRYDFFGPAQVAVCGDVHDHRLLDVGCGVGYFAREMARRGARVTGVDVSPRMIEIARRLELQSPLGIEYHVGDAVELESLFGTGTFDMATSCVALQDMLDPGRALRAVHASLKPGGRFVASITHPCSDTPFRRWERDESGNKRWLCVDRYFERTPLEFQWSGFGHYDFKTPAIHLTLEDWFGLVLEAGFDVRGLREPRPTEEALSVHPDLEDAGRVPYFLIFDLVARG